MQCLIDIGYAQTTTEKIAQKAGVSRGAMTHHFKSRAAVFWPRRRSTSPSCAPLEYDEVIKGVGMPVEDVPPTLEDMRDTIRLCRSTTQGRRSSRCTSCCAARVPTRTLRKVMAPLEVRSTKRSRRAS